MLLKLSLTTLLLFNDNNEILLSIFIFLLKNSFPIFFSAAPYEGATSKCLIFLKHFLNKLFFF